MTDVKSFAAAVVLAAVQGAALVDFEAVTSFGAKVDAVSIVPVPVVAPRLSLGSVSTS